jgi:hypothetical protein
VVVGAREMIDWTTKKSRTSTTKIQILLPTIFTA